MRKLKGFSLIEVLVTILILSFIITLLLPGLQNARESARQVSCKHNLARLSESCIRHESIVGHYPSAGWSYQWLGIGSRQTDGSQPGGWIFNILPYIDGKRIKEISVSYKILNNRSHQQNVLIYNAYSELINNSLSIFNCPSRRTSRPIRVDQALSFYTTASSLFNFNTSSRADYAGNGGSNGICPPLYLFSSRAVPAAVIQQANSRIKKIEICHNPLGRPDSGNTQNLPYNAVFDEGHSNHENDLLGGCDTCDKSIDNIIFTPSNLDEGDAWVNTPLEIRFALPDMGIPDLQNGLFVRMGVLRSGHIVDGFTNTYMIGEKYVAIDSYQTGLDSGDKSVMYCGYSSSNIRWTTDKPQRDNMSSNPNIFGSNHEYGFNMAFADGSVRFIDYHIDEKLHKSFGNRQDY